MLREDIFREIESQLGVVPTMFKEVSEERLELEWGLFKRTQLSDETIPAKYRELIGLAAGAVLGDRYCVIAHREFAKVCGATDEEIECALGLAKGVAGWGTYVSGLDLDLDTFRGEIAQACNFVRAKTGMVAGETVGRTGATH